MYRMSDFAMGFSNGILSLKQNYSRIDGVMVAVLAVLMLVLVGSIQRVSNRYLLHTSLRCKTETG